MGRNPAARRNLYQMHNTIKLGKDDAVEHMVNI